MSWLGLALSGCRWTAGYRWWRVGWATAWVGQHGEGGRGELVARPAAAGGCYRPTLAAICDVVLEVKRSRGETTSKESVRLLRFVRQPSVFCPFFCLNSHLSLLKSCKEGFFSLPGISEVEIKQKIWILESSALKSFITVRSSDLLLDQTVDWVVSGDDESWKDL